MPKNILTLLDAIHLPFNHPEYAPNPDGTTHCNGYVDEVCQLLGYKEFSGLLANAMIDLMSDSPQWSLVDMAQCQVLANQGSLIIGALKADPHGHVCVICPGKFKTSTRWGEVPTVANVGKNNFIGKGVNWSFSEYPKFYALRSLL